MLYQFLLYNVNQLYVPYTRSLFSLPPSTIPPFSKLQ